MPYEAPIGVRGRSRNSFYILSEINPITIQNFHLNLDGEVDILTSFMNIHNISTAIIIPSNGLTLATEISETGLINESLDIIPTPDISFDIAGHSLLQSDLIIPDDISIGIEVV